MSAIAKSREARCVSKLEKALDEMRRSVRWLISDMPARPSAQDPDSIREFLDSLPLLAEKIERAAADLKKLRSREDFKAVMTSAKGALEAVEPVQAGLRAMLARTPTPLVPEYSLSPRQRRVDVFSSAFVNMENAINGTTQDPSMQDYGFGFIAFCPMTFVERLQAVWRLMAVLDLTENVRFLDVGSGAGTKLYLASQFFSFTHGIELDQNYIDRRAAIANDGLDDEPGSRRGVMHCDALEFDRYDEYHVIYSYCPPLKVELQNKLEDKIWNSATEGTVIVAPSVRSSSMQQHSKAAPGVFVKGYEGDELKALVREAELIGPCVPPPPLRVTAAARKSPLYPLIVALSQAGFAITV